MNIELIIQHDKEYYQPAVEDGITWSTERSGVPGRLTFNMINDLTVSEGDAVRLKVDGANVFFGFIFTIKRTKDNLVSITAYDQLRYLKNKDTYVYENKTASQVVKMIAEDFKLNVGTVQSTSWKIPSRVEEDSSLFDIIQNALDLELQNKNEMFVLYDDFGKLTLKNVSSMKVDYLIDESVAENFDYSSSIDSNTYNQIKLTYDNKDTGTREVYMTKDSSHINQWGVLQYFEKLQSNENGKAKADALLKLYNEKTKSLDVSGIFGDVRCRAGAMPVVMLNLGDVKLQNYMLIDKATHTFKNDEHLMNLTLKGGGING